MARDLRSIRQRWRAARALSTWRRLESSQRELLLDDLEEMQRESLSAGDEVRTGALAAVVDLLDTLAADGALATWDEATADVEWLLAELENRKRRS